MQSHNSSAAAASPRHLLAVPSKDIQPKSMQQQSLLLLKTFIQSEELRSKNFHLFFSICLAFFAFMPFFSSFTTKCLNSGTAAASAATKCHLNANEKAIASVVADRITNAKLSAKFQDFPI